MIIDTLSVPFALVNTTNVTTASVTEPVPTTLDPGIAGINGGGVLGMGAQPGTDGQNTASAVKLVFFGAGSNGNTFTAYVYGWEKLQSVNFNVPPLWIPTLLATFTAVTLNSSITGVANTDIPAASLFASAMTLGVGNSGISVEVVSPGAGTAEIAHAVVSSKGCKYLEVRYAKGTATSCNALAKKM